MKAFLELELVGDDLDDRMKRLSKQLRSAHPDLYLGNIRPRKTNWVAEILGPGSRYRYERKFLKFHKSFTRANSIGSKGVFAEYTLESGHIYEVRNSRDTGHFCTVDENGDIITLSRETVDDIIGIGE